ncbi:MAG: acyl-CoA dehydrogenase family protein, partial [Marmoricola sp.]
LLADSVDYVQQRKQYGRQIGSYQAIKHRLADVRIALDFARPLVHGAALSGADLAAVAEGTVATVAVPPHVPFALDADVAEKVYLSVEGGFETVADASSSTIGIRSVDTTRKLFDLLGGRAASEASDQSRPLDHSDAFDHAVLACSAELLGCGERLLADSVDYVQQRKQYGRQIGSYQAIKHRLADIRIALDFARPLVHGAALSVATASTSASRDVSAAKVAAGDAAYVASRVALQVHGAIGYTAEFDLGLWINRVRALVGAWGGSTHHRSRIAESLTGSL